MGVKEAYSIVTRTIPGQKVIKCIEYNTLFVFQMVSKNLKPSIQPDEVMDCLWSVNKKTGGVRNFKPFDIPLDEYRNGKQVNNFK